MSLFVEKERARPRALWRLLWQFAIFSFAATLTTSILGGLAAGGNLPGPVASLFANSLGSLLALFVSLLVAGRFLDKRPLRDFGFRLSRRWFVDLGFGILLGAFLMGGIFLIQLACGWTTVTGTLVSGIRGVSFWFAILIPLASFVCVGIYEESLFRGYQFKNLAEGLNFPALGGPKGAVLLSWLLTSALFGLLHSTNPNASAQSTLNVALAGLLLGAGYALTGELAIPIGLHITWNFFEGSVFGFPVSGIRNLGASFLTTSGGGPVLWTGGRFGPEAGLLDPAAAVVGILLTLLYVRLRRGRTVAASIAEGPPVAGQKRV